MTCCQQFNSLNWLADLFINWLIGWLIDWLIDWMILTTHATDECRWVPWRWCVSETLHYLWLGPTVWLFHRTDYDDDDSINGVYAGTVELWPYLILLQAIPALISLAITPFMPDTPRYLMLIKHNQAAAQKGKRTVACVYRAYSLDPLYTWPTNSAET